MKPSQYYTFFISLILLGGITAFHIYSSLITWSFLNYYVLIVYFFIIFSSYVMHKKYNLYMLFICCSYIFFYGQLPLVIYGFDFAAPYRSILSDRIPFNTMIFTGVFICQCMLCLHIGYTFVSSNRCFAIKPERHHINYSFMIFPISLVVLLSGFFYGRELYLDVKTTFSYGYAERFLSIRYQSTGFTNIQRFCSLFFLPSCYLLLIIGNAKVQCRVLIILLFVSAIIFISGSRINAFITIIICTITYHYWIKRFTKSKIIIAIIIGVLLMIFISFISTVRSDVNSISSITELRMTLHDSICNSFVIFNVFEELGFTFSAIACVISYCPLYIDYNYGLSYLYGLLTIFPNIFDGKHIAASNTDVLFSKFYTEYGGIGSSFIAESYFNFGYFALLFICLYGFIIGIIIQYIEQSARSKQAIIFFISCYAFSLSLFYMRSDIANWPRNIVYFGLLPVAFAYSISSKKRNK